MTAHLILLSLIIGTGILLSLSRESRLVKNRRIIIVSFFFIFLVQGLRAQTVGADTLDYYAGFKIMLWRQDWNIYGWEPLYLKLNQFIAFFTDDPQWLLIVSALLMDIGFGIFIAKSAKDEISAFWPIFLFVCLLHYANSMNLLRQYLAMSLIIQSYFLLRDGKSKKKWIGVILIIIISTMIHTASAIYIFAFLPFLLKKIDTKIIFLSAMAIIIALIGFSYIFPIALRLFPKYSKYLQSSRIDGERFGVFYAFYFLLKVGFVLLVIFLDPARDEDKELYQLAYLVLISAGLLAMKTRVSLAMRTGYYFDIFFIVYAPKIINRIRRGKPILYSILFIYAVVFFVHTLPSSERRVIPYLFFWQNWY